MLPTIVLYGAVDHNLFGVQGHVKDWEMPNVQVGDL
jgi:hypothetical protein